ncbi:MAG: p-hydroxybenzoic acid efflux pump subunit AaeB [Candidatus Celerinatantimonas neptuna]|nr:MAG: p-hydroxybenzoic acid efflux pump subunit AaeB [Candidatus Celerinatantimonas neptuna]
MSTVLSLLLIPDRRSLQYAIKGVIAMAMALTIAMAFNLERPYWALISAVFLQIRPEAGLVIEKAICQICGTIIGGCMAILILNYLMPYPDLAIAVITLWIGFNAAMSAMVRQTNFIYAFAIAGLTTIIIVLIVMAIPAKISSASIFHIAQARVTEIIIGILCASTVSQLIWPMKVKNILCNQAKQVINQTLEYLSIELNLDEGTHENRHQRLDSIMHALSVVGDNASAVVYEGPQGPGHSRAANLLCQKILSLLSVVQIFGRLQRRHPELQTESLKALLDNLRKNFIFMSQTGDFESCYHCAKSQHQALIHYRLGRVSETPLESRLLKTAIEFSADLVILLKSYQALEQQNSIKLHAPKLRPYRDPLLGLTTGIRTSLSFLFGVFVWLNTGSYAALMLMILPVIFSIMFAQHPQMLLGSVFRKILIGTAIAIPVSIFYTLNLIAQSSGDIVELILILCSPLFIGLLAMANRPTLPYGLGFCLSYIVLVRPARNMTTPFSINLTLSSAMGIWIGVMILYWLFKLIEGPSQRLMQARLLKSTYRDLLNIHQQKDPEQWFNRRMADRLLRITYYDQGSTSRHLTDIGLTGLNLGHIFVRLERLLESIQPAGKRISLSEWQKAMATAYIDCSKGHYTQDYQHVCEQLLETIHQHCTNNPQIKIIQGLFERLDLSFQRTAEIVQETS